MRAIIAFIILLTSNITITEASYNDYSNQYIVIKNNSSKSEHKHLITDCFYTTACDARSSSDVTGHTPEYQLAGIFSKLRKSRRTKSKRSKSKSLIVPISKKRRSTKSRKSTKSSTSIYYSTLPFIATDKSVRETKSYGYSSKKYLKAIKTQKTKALAEAKKSRTLKTQRLLNEHGFNSGTADGIFGKKTRSALFAFLIVSELVDGDKQQEKLNLSDIEITDELIWRLENYSNRETQVNSASKVSDVDKLHAAEYHDLTQQKTQVNRPRNDRREQSEIMSRVSLSCKKRHDSNIHQNEIPRSHKYLVQKIPDNLGSLFWVATMSLAGFWVGRVSKD